MEEESLETDHLDHLEHDNSTMKHHDNDDNNNDDDDNDNDNKDDMKNNTDDGRTTIESVDITVVPMLSSSSSSSSLVQDNDNNNNVVTNTIDIDKSNRTEPSSSLEPQPSSSLEPQPSSSLEPQPSSSLEPQPSSSLEPQVSRSNQHAPCVPFDSTMPPADPRCLTLKNLDTGEEFVIGENDPDFEWDTFEIGERRTEERLSHESQKASWLSYIYSIFYNQKDDKSRSDKNSKSPKRARTPFTKLSSFKMRRELGRGAFGRVLLAEAKIDNKLYALKIISKQSIRTNADKTQAKAERDILHAMSYSNPHPFTSGLKFAFQSENNLYLGMDFLPGGNLRELIKRHKVLPEKWVQFYSSELVLALAHLHSINVLYRDIKPHNVMIDGRGHVIIIDFGLSKWDRENYKNKDRAMSLVGTPDYSAPEVLRTGVYQIEKKRQSSDYNAKTGYRNKNRRSNEPDENYGYGKAADWWSLGIMIYEMLSGTPAFRGADLRQTYQKVLFSELEFKPIELFSESAKALLVGLLDRIPETRLGSGKNSPQDIKSAQFFKGVDWDRVFSRAEDGPWIPEPVVFRRKSNHETINEMKNIQNELNDGNENVAQNDVQPDRNESVDTEPTHTGSVSNVTMQMRESIFSSSMTNNGNKLQGWSFFDEQALAHAIEKNNDEHEKEIKIQQLLL